MRALIVLVGTMLFAASQAYAVGEGSAPSAQKDPPASQYKRVPMEFFGGEVKKKGRWIRVHGYGDMYLAPRFPSPFPRCTVSSGPNDRCYEEIERP